MTSHNIKCLYRRFLKEELPPDTCLICGRRKAIGKLVCDKCKKEYGKNADGKVGNY